MNDTTPHDVDGSNLYARSTMAVFPLGVLRTENFSRDYFKLHDYIANHAEVVPSRNGITRETRDFKTELTNPVARCTGGYGRDANIFFSLAEAMWMFAGRRDVAFLEIFNKQMRQYSDDGRYFHAPYGWRLRKHGLHSNVQSTPDNIHVFDKAPDQVAKALEMLDQDPESRRVVMSIWNADLDLNKKSKDLPCNDLVMLQVRNRGLEITIANRSNDLNWGLTTNVFQFSWMGEQWAKCLGMYFSLTKQTHNSKSLHIYLETPLTKQLQSNIEAPENEKGFNGFYQTLYDWCKPCPTEFALSFFEEPLNVRLARCDFYINGMILKLTDRFMGRTDAIAEYEADGIFEGELKSFNKTWYYQFKVLQVYVDYKLHRSHAKAIEALKALDEKYGLHRFDFFVLALNFFYARLMRTNIGLYADLLSRYYPKALYLGRL